MSFASRVSNPTPGLQHTHSQGWRGSCIPQTATQVPRQPESRSAMGGWGHHGAVLPQQRSTSFPLQQHTWTQRAPCKSVSVMLCDRPCGGGGGFPKFHLGNRMKGAQCVRKAPEGQGWEVGQSRHPETVAHNNLPHSREFARRVDFKCSQQKWLVCEVVSVLISFT